MAKTTKRIGPKKGKLPDVALDSPIVEEDLPLKFVHYPNHYGAFFMFSSTPNEDAYFCECCYEAVHNSFKLVQYESNNNWSDEKVAAPLSSHLFPNEISKASLKTDLSKLLRFKKKLCHRCNMATPSLRYCHEMYGGNFKQYYGWYIKQTAFRIGVRDTNYIEDYAPDDLIEKIDLINEKQKLINSKVQDSTSSMSETVQKYQKEVSKLKKSINKKIENITREEFGFRKIGEGNVSETILTKIVQRILPEYEILRHHRPEWLDGLELDIFIPELKMGIEYQGQQHFHPVEAWGGEKALEELKERDIKKKALCEELNVKLVEVDYTEPLNENFIDKKLSEVIDD
ncbi:MAG: hypothetical protein U5J95_02480 [Balneolaceae bacterium]|nr:hypothetical protein [Balneolaceae bacterium]